jgi:hypothetical protein
VINALHQGISLLEFLGEGRPGEEGGKLIIGASAR